MSSLPHMPSAGLLKWFTWYSRRYVGKHFHALRISSSGLPPESGKAPVVVFSNHPGWWDPLIGLLLKERYYGGKTLHAPIEAEALEKYGILKKLGFFPVKRSSFKGARDFLRVSQALLKNPDTLLALTPQGRFADARHRPIGFEPGLSHLAALAPEAVYVPCAIEYTFWDERLPEALVHFGAPVAVKRGERARELNERMQAGLETAQNGLAHLAITRDPTHFQTLISGSAGQGGVYDLWRSLTAALKGKTFHPEHSER